MRRLYWIKEGLRMAATVLIACVVYTSLIAFTVNANYTLPEHLENAFVYTSLLSSIIGFFFNIFSYQSLIPIALSFGCTRRETMLGVQLFRLAYFIPPLLASAVLAFLMGSDAGIDPFAMISISTSMYLSGSSLGALAGAFTAKNMGGRSLAILITTVILGNIVAFVVSFVILAPIDQLRMMLWIMPVIGGVSYLVCSIFEARALKRCCVR